MQKLQLPLLSKWACIFSIKGRARHLDMVEMFADGSFNNYPYASINLDAPLVLLNPSHEDNNATRPSNIAQACDLLSDQESYGLLRLVEEHIIAKDLCRAINPLLFTIGGFDDRHLPNKLTVLPYGEAIAQLRETRSPTRAFKPKA